MSDSNLQFLDSSKIINPNATIPLPKCNHQACHCQNLLGMFHEIWSSYQDEFIETVTTTQQGVSSRGVLCANLLAKKKINKSDSIVQVKHAYIPQNELIITDNSVLTILKTYQPTKEIFYWVKFDDPFNMELFRVLPFTPANIDPNRLN